MNNLPNNKKAFTLIELLVVVSVLGILGTLITIRFTGAQSSAQDAKRQSELKQYQTSLEVYANANNSAYPVAAGNLVSICSTLGLGSACPDDPDTSKHYEYNSSGARYVVWATLDRKNNSGNTEYFILCSNGQVGKSTTEPTSSTCPL